MTAPAMETLALHTEAPPACWEGGPARHLAPPITPAATFELPTGQEVAGEPVYGRYGNPSRSHLETVLARLENSKTCLLFSSGMAAAHAVLQTVGPGDHVVAGDSLYGGVLSLIAQLVHTGVQVTFTPASDPASVASKVRENTKIVWLEVCTNPTLNILHIKKTVQCVKAENPRARIVIDNTFLTPWVVRPLDLGADIVMHSVTKYLNGHSDVIMGALLLNDPELGERLYRIQKYRGATPSPFDCYLVQRSLATLTLRMERHMKSSLEVAEFLLQQPQVETVIHPLLPGHPQHQLVQDQHAGRHSGMVTFSLGSGEEAASLLSNLKMVKVAASLGSSHSLVCQPARLTHAMCSDQERREAGVTEGMVRLSVGLENVQDIIKDLRDAFAVVFK